MINLKRPAVLVASVLLLSGCDTLFNAGFEWDQPGQPPATDLKGFPYGDSITTGQPKSFFVTSRHGIVGKRSYAFVEALPKAGAPPARTILRSAPVEDLTRPVYVTWGGKFGPGGSMTTIVGYQGQQYVQLQFSGGDVIVEDKVVSHYTPGDNHTVVVSLFPEEQVYRVALSGDVGLEQPYIQGKARSKAKVTGPQVVADFTITSSANENLVYIMDDARMSHSRPQ